MRNAPVRLPLERSQLRNRQGVSVALFVAIPADLLQFTEIFAEQNAGGAAETV
jgi:hypothetical protein